MVLVFVIVLVVVLVLMIVLVLVFVLVLILVLWIQVARTRLGLPARSENWPTFTVAEMVPVVGVTVSV